MIDISDHGGKFSGGKGGVDFKAQNFSPRPQVFQAGSYERVQVGNTVAIVRAGNQLLNTFDLLTGTRIAAQAATGASGNVDWPYPIMDEKDDLIYGYSYEYGASTSYRPRAHNKNFAKIWESAITDSLGVNGYLTDDYLFLAGPGKIYKISRLDGTFVSAANGFVQDNVKQVFGTNDDQTQIIYLCRSTVVIINIADLTQIKAVSISEVFEDSYAYPYGVAIKDGVLHVLTYSSQNYVVQHWAYPVDASVYDSTTRLFQQQASANSWENGNNNQGVKTLKKGILVSLHKTLEVIQFKLGDVGIKKTTLSGDGELYRPHGNNKYYFNYAVNGQISHFGKIIQS